MSLHTGRVYKDVVCRRKTFHVFLRSSSFCLFLSLAFSLAHSLFLSLFSSLTLQSRIRILELRTRSHSFNVEGSQFHIYLLYSFSFYGKSIKDYWFSFCICAYLSCFFLRIPCVIRFDFVGPVWQCLVN